MSDIDKLLDMIGDTLGVPATETLREGLPDGDYPRWGYDEQLVFDIAMACQKWKERQDNGKA